MARILDDFESQELIKPDDKDDAVNDKFDWAKTNGKEQAQKIKDRIKEHNEFYDGDQIKYQLPQYKSDSVFNFIMPGVINMVGLLTDANFGPQVHPMPVDNEDEFEKNRIKAKQFEQALICLWDKLGVPEKATKMLYKYIIEEDVIIVPKWNYKEDEVDFEISSIGDWVFSKGSGSVENSPWAIRTSHKDWNFFANTFPDRIEEIKEKLKKKNKGPDSEGRFEVEEYFTDEVYVMRVQDLVLRNETNPYFEFRDKTRQREEHDEKGFSKQKIPFNEVRNYFKNPKKPVIQLSAYNSGELYSRSRMKQLLKPQVDLNKRMQQMDDNLVLGSSGIWIYDTLMISKTEMDKVSFKPYQKIGVQGGSESLHREAGPGLPSGMVENTMQVQRAFDDIFGYHEVSRGQKVRTQTYGEAALLREADQTSIRLLSRNYQAALENLMRWWAQLISLFYTMDHYLQWSDESGVEQFIKIKREDVSAGMHIKVKVGAQLSKDKAQQQEEISMLAQAGRIDPLTLYETLDYPNPRRLANRLVNWTKYQVISDEQLSGEGGPGQGNEQVLKQQAALAAEENERMSRGEQVEVNQDDVDQVHMEIHQSFPQQNQLTAVHLEQHQMRMQGGEQQLPMQQ